MVNVLCTYPSGAFMLKNRNVCRSITQVLEKLLGLSLRTPSVGCLWLTCVSHSLLFFKQAPHIIQSLLNSLTLNLHIIPNSSGALAAVHFYSRRQWKTVIRPSTGYLYCQRPATTSIANSDVCRSCSALWCGHFYHFFVGISVLNSKLCTIHSEGINQSDITIDTLIMHESS